MRNPDEFSERLEVFFGEASDTVARVYARLRGPEADQGFQLTGSLVGPSCLYAETLPARFEFVDRGPGESLLAEAVVPEPCFWTPEMPHLYRVAIELRHGEEILASAQRDFGIRTLGASGRKLYYDGKRWVMRAIASDEVPATELAEWREADATLWIKNPSEPLCEDTSRVGVLLIAELDAPDERQIRRLARWPAVGVAVLPDDAAFAATLERSGHNLLLAQRFAAHQPVVCQPWAQLALVEVGANENLAARTVDCRAAIIAMRPAGKLKDVAAGRTACDRLQRDLAPQGDWAGFIV